MSSTQKTSNTFNLYAAKEVYSKSNPVRSADANTAKAISDAQLRSYGYGYFVGLNGIAYNQNVEGILNSHLNPKDKSYTEAYGEHPKHSLVLIA